MAGKEGEDKLAAVAGEEVELRPIQAFHLTRFNNGGWHVFQGDAVPRDANHGRRLSCDFDNPSLPSLNNFFRMVRVWV